MKEMHSRIETTALLLAAGFAFVCAVYFSQLKFNLVWLWVLTPYVVLLVMSRLVLASNESPALANSAVAIIVLVFTVILYIDGLFLHTSSTSPLLFIFIPLYLLVGGPLLLGLWLGVGKLIDGRNHELT